MKNSYIFFDTEYTSWEGSLESNWSRPGELKEIVQIGGVKITDLCTFHEATLFNQYVFPCGNPQLSDYFKHLTGISQEFLDRHAVTLTFAIKKFNEFCGDHKVFSWGNDFSVIENNLRLQGLSNPLNASNFHDLKSLYKSRGLAVDEIASGDISTLFAESSYFEPGKKHDALSDAISIASSLNKLTKQTGSDYVIKMLSL